MQAESPVLWQTFIDSIISILLGTAHQTILLRHLGMCGNGTGSIKGMRSEVLNYHLPLTPYVRMPVYYYSVTTSNNGR